MVFFFCRHKIHAMQKLLLFVDRISTWVGQAFSFFIIALTLHVSWEVFSRYALDNPRAGAFVLVQGIVEIIRCIICLKTGTWPSREEDVVEVDVDKLKQELHVKDEDIQKLDQYVVKQERK